jgi:dTDP-4-dehydrorhamnose 3,5-epimerase
MIKFCETLIKDCFLVSVERHKDNRGFLQEVFNANEYPFVKTPWKQVNWSSSVKGTLRGIHVSPYGKLITCVKGRINDVAIDLRPESSTYLQWFSATLDAEVPQQLYIPSYCGHAFLCLSDDCTVVYLQEGTYDPDEEKTFGYNNYNIPWPKMDYILSDKDSLAAGSR